MKIVRPITVTDAGSFTRATIGTYFDVNGAMQTAAINVPRFNYDPANLLAGPSLLLEAAATNLFLNSATVATQTISLSAGTYVLSAWGSGSVLLSGASTGTFTGANASTRTSMSFVSSGGSVTLTVLGTLTLGQVELGSAATSYIATTGASATRSADVNTAMLVTNVPETDYAFWSAATTYAIGDRVLYTDHYIYQSSTAGNINHLPTDTANWIKVQADNRWSMFDQSVTSQTTQTSNITVAIVPGARIDSLIGLNCSALKATINVVDPQYGNVYSKVVTLTSYSGIADWYAYFYEPIVQVPDFVLTDLPAQYSSAMITVCITATTAAIGALILGQSKEIGQTEWGAKPAIIDYSIKTKDAFGNYSITPRAFSKRADLSIKVPTDQVDALVNLLAGYRTVPVVYIGSNSTAKQQFNSVAIYGFYKDFSVDIAYPSHSTCTLQIEGLT